jgi:excisionase family DNA binding protein
MSDRKFLNERLLPTNVVAQRLHKSERTVRWYANSGKLRAVRTGLKLWKFRRVDVEDFVRSYEGRDPSPCNSR